jgi:hypothetical protein
MTHTDYQNSINLYIDNALNDNDASDLFTHLAACAECRTIMKISMRIRTEIMDGELADIPQSLDARVLASVAPQRTVPRHRPWYAPIWFTRISIPLPAAASILFLMIVGSLLLYPLLTADRPPRVEIPAEIKAQIPAALQREF